MTKGSNGYGKSGSKTVATIGYISTVPAKTSGGVKDSYQTTSRASYCDKESGSYGRATTTEKASAGDFYWKNGTTGTRSEYTQSSTVRIGDKSGYTEVHSEQSVRNVTYSNSSSSSKNYITCDNDNGGYVGGGQYGGSGNGYDSYGGGQYGGNGYDGYGGGQYSGNGYDGYGGGYDGYGGGQYGGGAGYDGYGGGQYGGNGYGNDSGY